MPTIIELGAAEFAKIGSESSPGTAIFSISGNVVRPGNYELELGTPMRELIYDLAGGIAGRPRAEGGHPGRLVGAGAVARPDRRRRSTTTRSRAIGTFFGAASLIVVDDRCCMVQLALRSTKFYMHESCGKCTPCREGTRWMVQTAREDRGGRGRPRRPRRCSRSVGSRILGKSLCALGDFAVYPVASYIEKWRSRVRGARRARPLPVRRRVDARGDRRSERRARPRPARGARMSAPELVTLTIDGREVSVPKGTGLVEAALAAGIEIPVFCYEPRLGPPVGACRMCLCEVAPGPPKPQAACTLTAAEGMVVKTARTSALAAEAQNATLEFILVNHPLDCPVCDKGGECPLQDLTFRYGPGIDADERSRSARSRSRSRSRRRSRSTASAASSATAARASRSRSPRTGSSSRSTAAPHSMIATFADEPYRAPFSGNVIELCPVGALTSTQYRFEARPWEIQNVPTVCGLCPVGCNISATTREGKVKRILSRNHPEVDEGWLCDKGRFALRPPARRRPDRRPAAPGRRSGFEALAWDDGARPGRAACCAGAGQRDRDRALGHRDRRAGLRARAGCSAAGSARTRRVLPEAIPDALDAFRGAALGDPRGARRSSSSATSRSSSARRSSTSGSRPPARTARRSSPSCREAPIEGAVLVHRRRRARRLARAATSAPTAAFYLPRTPNGRGVADAWSCRRRRRGRSTREPGAASSSPATRPPLDPARARARGRARRP